MRRGRTRTSFKYIMILCISLHRVIVTNEADTCPRRDVILLITHSGHYFQFFNLQLLLNHWLEIFFTGNLENRARFRKREIPRASLVKFLGTPATAYYYGVRQIELRIHRCRGDDKLRVVRCSPTETRTTIVRS